MFLALGAALLIATASGMLSPAPASATSPPKDACAAKSSKYLRDQCEKFTHSAPGDEYFGRMKMSYLGIDNTFHDEAIRAGAYTTDSGIISKVEFADDALVQWAHRYPGDPQLARSYFLAVGVYQKIYTVDAQNKAWAYMHVLVQKYPNTYFGKVTKTNLKRGFTEHYFAEAKPCGASAASAEPMHAPDPGHPNVVILAAPCIASSPSP